MFVSGSSCCCLLWGGRHCEGADEVMTKKYEANHCNDEKGDNRDNDEKDDDDVDDESI